MENADESSGELQSQVGTLRRFHDREDAGRQLAAKLMPYANQEPIVLGLPRGGVPVAYEVALALGAPLDIWVVRKVGVPWHPELGVGAVAEGNYVYVSPEILNAVGLRRDEVSEVVEEKRAEVAERVRRFRGERRPPDLRDRTVILVDDGIATGGTVRAAARAVKAASPRRIVLAVPVASPDTLDELASEVDETVCLLSPSNLYAIGLWYEDFRQVPDDEVVKLLERARAERRPRSHRMGQGRRA
jgi:putative phosphoribosyl transferase